MIDSFPACSSLGFSKIIRGWRVLGPEALTPPKKNQAGIFIGILIGIATEPLFQKNYVRLVRTREQKGGEPGGAEPEVYTLKSFLLDPSIELEGHIEISVARDLSEPRVIDCATIISIDYRLRLWEARWLPSVFSGK